MADNKKQQNELKALREKLNDAERRRNYPVMLEAAQAIIKLGEKAPALNIMTCLYYKDLGTAYLKLLEYENALKSFRTAHEGLVKYRATQKLKYEDDWLNELKAIERLIEKIERVHFKGVV